MKAENCPALESFIEIYTDSPKFWKYLYIVFLEQIPRI